MAKRRNLIYMFVILNHHCPTVLSTNSNSPHVDEQRHAAQVFANVQLIWSQQQSTPNNK